MDTRPNRSDRHTERGGNLFVVETDHVTQHDCGPELRGEPGDRRLHVVGQSLSEAEAAVTATADRLRTAAARYRTADAAVEERVAAIRSRLGDGP